MISIIPRPLKLVEMSGEFKYTFSTKIGGEFEKTKMQLLEIFSKCGVEASVVSGNGDINFVMNNTLDKEGYILNVAENQITIYASSEAGAFYAVQTLRQICSVDTLSGVSDVSIPCCDIEDKPRFKRRAFMLDIARHFSTMDTIKECLDMMALNKLNVFHWHLTDDQGWRIEIKKYPLLTQRGAVRKATMLAGGVMEEKEYGDGLYYTQEQVKEVIEYAKNLHIEVMPEIDMPGHLVAAIHCYPELSCEGKQIDVFPRWGILDDIGCVGGDKLMPFVKDIIDELAELFPYEYFHIGGDEVPKKKWKNCPKCQAKIKELGLKGEEELQGWFNNQILEYLKTKNKYMIGWNEILKATELSDETIIQWWIHSAKASGVDKWLAKGNKVILTPEPYLYMDHCYDMKDLKKYYSVDLDTMRLSEKYESQVLGIEAPLWTEYVRCKEKLQFNIYPRMQDLGEINWTSKENKNFADFESRLPVQMKIMDAKNIVYAKRDAYLVRGFKNWGRKSKAWLNWQKNQNHEFEKYNKI